MTGLDGPRRVRLASGSEASVLVLRPQNWSMEPGDQQAPQPHEARVAKILGDARNECHLTPVPGPMERLPNPERIGALDVFSARGKAAVLAPGPTLSPLFLMRQRATDLAADELMTNASYFLFTKPDWDAPWNACGDPVGLVMAGGDVAFPPQLPRACLLRSGPRTDVARLGFASTGIALPDKQTVRAHPFGAAITTKPFTAFARFYGAVAGHAPLGEGYDLAYLGRWPLVGGAAGSVEIPRAGCVVRFPDRDIAQEAAQASLRYTLPGDWTEGVQAGPQILRAGQITEAEGVFAKEHMTETALLPEQSSVSPAAWRADWDETRAARLGAGVDAEGRAVLVAIEGGSSGLAGSAAARGATLRDLALLMQQTGAIEALHLDGGGSTQVFGQAGGALIAPNDMHHALLDRQAQYDRPVPNWLRLKL